MKNGKLGLSFAKLTVVATLAVCVVYVSCTGKNNSSANVSRNSSTTTTSSVIEQLKQNYDSQQNSANVTSAEQTNSVKNSSQNTSEVENADNRSLDSHIRSLSHDGIDVDLTQLSATMVYAEVFNMLVSPESYVGKTIKMRGNFNYFQAMLPTGEMINRLFYSCSIADATACCQQGLEFELKGDKKFPVDYPKMGSEITVVGTFEIYDDYGYTGMRIKDAEFV